jgi:hypothetical protein
MKITLWQQFSSNHSASFDIVGKFESAEKAERAAEELRDMLRKILIARQQEGDQSWWATGTLSPMEQELRQKYNVQWSQEAFNSTGEPKPIDYLTNLRDLRNHVNQFEDRVLVRNYHETHLNSAPFRELLERFGGMISGSEGWDAEFKLVVEATAPDEGVAELLLDDVRYFPAGIDPRYDWDAYFVSGLELIDQPAREGNSIMYRFDAFVDKLPWNYVIKMREYLTALGCTMDYYFEG